MLAVQDAVKRSVASFAELFPSDTFKDLRLEEVGISDDQQQWNVTLSYKNPDFDQEVNAQREANQGLLAAFGGLKLADPVASRRFKIVTLNSLDGSLVSVRNV